MSYQLRDGSTVEDPRLGRLASFDERSKNFPIRSLVATNPFPTRGRGWSVRHWLDQQREGACVSFAWHHEAGASPARATFNDPTGNVLAFSRYHEMQKVDEWPGEDYEGTSVLAGAKVMQGLGYHDSYHWAFTLNDIIMALAYEGPVVMGTNWYEGMYNPDSKGLLHIEGEVVGGHSYLLSSFSVVNKTVTVWNSWGQGWGDNGRAKLSWADLEELLYKDGDSCLPTNRHVV